ncbi:MAG: metal-dependent transcriptional regulator [Ruminococcus sp.]|nr:metal-dependent transcriptional regulator [Ruminococcus sp.]
MALRESGEDYLETILILQNRTGYVRSIDIANELGYSKPSISRAMGILKASGFITVEKDGQIVLTDEGLKRASGVYERHLLLTRFLNEMLGVTMENAENDACHIEHVISQETFEKLRDYVDQNLGSKE